MRILAAKSVRSSIPNNAHFVAGSLTVTPSGFTSCGTAAEP